MSKHIPDSLKGVKSPFTDNLVIPIFTRYNTEDVSNPSKSVIKNDIIVATGETHKISRSYTLEKDRKVDLYYENNGEDLKPYYTALSKEGRMLLDYILFYCLRENKLLCYIDTKDFMDKYMIKSRTTLWNSKKNLINLTFITSTSCQNWYWINPKFMFKGYRSKVIELKDNLKYTTKED